MYIYIAHIRGHLTNQGTFKRDSTVCIYTLLTLERLDTLDEEHIRRNQTNTLSCCIQYHILHSPDSDDRLWNWDSYSMGQSGWSQEDRIFLLHQNHTVH